jgi:hypothetical protein
LILLPEAVFKTTESMQVRMGWDCRGGKGGEGRGRVREGRFPGSPDL